MKYGTFYELWNKWSSLWLDTTIDLDGEQKKFGDICQFKENAQQIVYENYESYKKVVKNSYFKNAKDCPKLNRYKRAAVLTYAVVQSQPLSLREECLNFGDTELLLKERFAFFISIASVIQDFRKKDIDKLKIFDVMKRIGTRDQKEGNDTFLCSVYKDIFFSEVYSNYNILSMANVYGLLMEEAIGIKNIPVIKPSTEDK